MISELLFQVIAGISVLFSLSMFIGWRKIPYSKTSDDFIPELKVTVLVPVRNEEENIGNLLIDLENQHYPKQLLEVILINDHSTDSTRNKALEISNGLRIKILMLDNYGTGKKEAIESGIMNASGELIVTTDGDCRVQEKWIRSIVSFMKRKSAVMISGPVRYMDAGGAFRSALMMEFAALQGTGAVSLYWKMPSMCNGSNLAYLKKTFVEVGGFEGNRHIPSGDDEFLMHRISKKYPGRVHYLKSRASVVSTKAPPDLTNWIHQRIRWASKWKGYESISPKIIAFVVILFNLNIIYGIILASVFSMDWLIFLSFFLIKLIIDFVFVSLVNHFLAQRSNLLIFIIMEIFYPVYALSFGILGLAGNYTWKGRRFE